MAGTNHDEWRIFVAEQYDFAGNPILTEPEYDAATIALWGPLLGSFVEFFYPYAAARRTGAGRFRHRRDLRLLCAQRRPTALEFHKHLRL